MNVTISPIGIGMAMIVVSNCLISFGKSEVKKKCYIILSSILSMVGILGIITTRSQFISGLNKSANRQHLDSDFVLWATTKFDFFAVISIIATCSTIIFLLYLLRANKKNKSGFVWGNFSTFVIVIMVINFLAGAWYGFRTINVLFDIAFYIATLSISEIFALYIPLIAKRIVTLKE
ncbi:MAG: hypothetical protein NHB14_12320 [Desulfosporosinus sp.]|nr:hypothetical protein [Desulfosporosinus sp.]